MNTKKLCKISGALGVTALTLMIALQMPARDVVAACQQQTQISATGTELVQLNCQHTPQQSWMSWFQGNSRSTQFHFIDLLELLNRLHSKQSTPSQ